MIDPNALPTSGPMATEPARTLAEKFANKTVIQPVISAVVALVAGLFKITVADDLVDNITTIIMFIAILVTPILANTEQATLAREQGEQTRKAVYAPATVARIADQQYEAGKPVTQPQPDVPAPPAQ